jgi:transcriptional regulator with XRE-family HTH domain
MSVQFHFDVLPVRPPIEPRESLTGYLTRLAIANKCRRVPHLWQQLLEQGQLKMRTLDFPPPAAQKLAQILSCPEKTVLRTTFYYLLRHLEVSVTTRSLAVFLRGNISYSLRYCPACFGEHPIYRLAWRFLALPGCSKHGYALCDRCSHCEQRFPLISVPDLFGRCPSCGMSLLTARPVSLNQAELEKTAYIENELDFWLSPVKEHEAEQPNYARALGEKLSSLREEHGLSRYDVANTLGLWVDRIDAIESGQVSGTRLCDFLAYMRLLNASMYELSLCSSSEANIDHSISTMLEPLRGNRIDTSLSYGSDNAPNEEDSEHLVCEDELWVKRIENAVIQTGIAGEVLSQQRILEHLGVRRETIASFPQALALLERIGRASYRSTDQVLSNQVQGLLDAMRMLGMQPTGNKVGELLQLSLSTLSYYPSVNRLLKNECSFSETDDQLHQHYLADQIVIASQVLASMGHQVTVQSICRGILCPLPNLLCYPFIRVLLESIAEDFEHIENRSYESFEIDKIRTLLLCANEAQSDTCNLRRTALLDHLKLSEHDLLQYPNVRIAMEYILTSMWRLENGSAQRVEQSVVDAIHNIVSDLRQQGRAVSDKRIRAGLIERRFYLNRFPRARSTLRQVLAAEKLSCYEGSEHVAEDPVNRIAVPPENKPRRRKRLSFAEREKHYQQLTRSAIGELRRLNQPITMKAICAIAGMGKNLCYRYPSIMEMVETSRREDSS